MPQVTHFSANDRIDDMLAALQEDAAVILDGVLNHAHLDAIKAEIAPFVSGGDSGRDEFAGFKTKRICALMARSPT